MPTPAPKLILPQSFSLVSKGPPRVLLSEGKRYVEQLDAKGKSYPNAQFIAGDDASDSIFAEGLAMQAVGEKRREVARRNSGGQSTNDSPDSLVSADIALANARSENAELRIQLDALRLSNESLSSEVGSQQERINGLERENVRLSALPERVDLENLELRLAAAQRNLLLMEGAMGLSGIPVESVVCGGLRPMEGHSVDSYADRIANAKTPEQQHNVITAFQTAVRDGLVKARGR